MVLGLGDDQKQGHEYDDNRPDWLEPYKRNDSEEDDLENSYNAPSATDDDLPAGHPSRKKKFEPDELKQGEEAGAGGDSSWQTNVAGDSEQDKVNDLGSRRRKIASTLLFGRNGKEGKGRTKIASRGAPLLVGGSVGLGTVAIIVTLLMLIGSLKNVHFATVLRSAGFARFNYVMKKQFAQTVFDAAVLTDESTGRLELGERSLIDKLRRINPEKQLAKLGREGTLKFDFEGENRWGGLSRTNTFRGIEVNGKAINLDELAKQSFPERSGFNDLSFRERLRVRAQFVDLAKEGLADRLALEGRSFRGSVYKGLREASGISMSRWRQAARDYAGKTPAEARIQNVEDTVRNVEGDTPRPSSISSDINEQAEAEHQAAFDEASGKVKNGTRMSERRVRLAERADAMGKFSSIVLASTVACIVHDLDNSFEGLETNREQQVLRFGHDIQTTSDQTRDGKVVAEAVGAENARWEGSQNAAYYKAVQNKPLSPADLQQIEETPDIRPPNLLFANVISAVNEAIEYSVGGGAIEAATHLPIIGSNIKDGQVKLINGGCTVILNEYVQYSLAAIEIGVAIFTAGGSEALAQSIMQGIKVSLTMAGFVAGGHVVGTMIEKALDSYANTEYSGLATGESLFNQGYVSTDLLQQTGTRKVNFGRPLTTAEAGNAQAVAMNDLKAESRQRPLRDRYFAIENPYSLIGNLASVTPTNLTSTSQAMAGLLGSLPVNLASAVGHFSSSLTKPLSKSAFADISSIEEKYGTKGVEEWGFSVDELNKIDTDEAYSTDRLVEFVEPQLDALDAKYLPCYTYDFQTEPSEACTQDIRNQLASEEGLKWRTYRARSYAADVLAGNLSNE